MMPSTYVPVSGPPCPPVRTYTWSNAWNALMIDITITNATAPRINGTVIDKNCRISDAPSSLAASYRMCGTPCIAASRTTVAKGTLFQTLTMQSDTIAHFGSVSHGIGPIPTQPSMVFNRPLFVLNTNCQTTAITTADTAS